MHTKTYPAPALRENFRSREHSLLGTFVPAELSFLQKDIPRTFAPVVKKRPKAVANGYTPHSNVPALI